MATSLANQLSVIAANSEQSLNLKALKARHSKSLIFEPRIAASQSIETIYVLCYEGFQELCLLDGRFLEFRNDLFSEQSQEKDRSQMTAAQNNALDIRLEAFLSLVGGRLRLAPAIKAIEWLVRRFRIHEYNTSFFLFTFLPYHTLPIFTTLLSILPPHLPQDFNFLRPYIRSLSHLPRHAIGQAAIKNISFASSFSSYVVKTCKMRCHYPALVAFWAGIMTQVTGYMLDRAKSGRKSVQLQNEQDVVLKIVPILRDCLSLRSVTELHIASYIVLSIFASKCQLDEKLLTAMMEEVALGLNDDTTLPGIVCLSLLAQQRGAKQLTKRLTKYLTTKCNLPKVLVEVSQQCRVDKLANGICLALIERLKKNGDVSGLKIIRQIIYDKLLSESQVVVIIKALILVAYQIDDSHHEAQTHLAKFLVNMTELPGHSGLVVQKAFRQSEVDIDVLELKLHTSFLTRPKSDEKSDLNLESTQDLSLNSMLDTKSILENLPKSVDNDFSFLSSEASQIYSQLCQAFIACTSNSKTMHMFDELPILSRDTSLENTKYFSFYMRTWCGPYPVSSRVCALQLVSRCLSEKKFELDFQAIIPYAIAALNDTSARVRRSTIEVLQAINLYYISSSEAKGISSKTPIWAFNNFYGTDRTKSLNWMPTNTAARLMSEIIIPNLEECALDRNHIESIFKKSFETSRSLGTRNGHEPGNLSQSSRNSIYSFLASQILSTPSFTVKSRLLACANQVRSIGSSTRTRFLFPAIEEWSSLNQAQVTDLCESENLQVSALEDQYLKIIIAKDEEGVRFLHKIIEAQVSSLRPTLLNAVFKRLEELWPLLKSNLRLETADVLLKALDPLQNTGNSTICEAVEDLLQKVSLSTDILLHFLDGLPSAAELTDTPPAKKRRRNSDGEALSTPTSVSESFTAAIRRIMLVLKLVEHSEPEKHPELLKALFNILAELQQFKALVTSELAYLQTLVLGSLLAIVKTFSSNSSLQIDPSAVRSDLLVECVHKTTSPQVQNAALLLISSIAHTAPQLVFHSVMPIFTFMGNSTLQQNDDYSAHVINQTIREVIPPIIASLRLEKVDPVTGAAELLLSFVAAYEHVPPHRRNGLYSSLVRTLGPQDFLFALIAMLVDKYNYSEGVKSFSTEICGLFSVEVQLHTALKYIGLISDILSPSPKYFGLLINTNDDAKKNPHLVALRQLSLLPQILSQNKLITQAAKLLSNDDMDSVRIRELYSWLLEQALALTDNLKEHKSLHNACSDVIENILGLLSTAEFLKSVETLLDKPDGSLRRKILRSLELRLDKEKSSNTVSRAAMLGFLPQLIAIIRDSQDIQYQQVAVSCIEKISKKYGKKDIEAVTAAAEIIASNHCLGQKNSELRVMALLCLTSLVEILREAIIPVLPAAITKTLEYLKISLLPGVEAQDLQNGCYIFFSALAHHLPYIISGPYLDKLLEISSESAKALPDAEVTESRIQCLSLIGKNIDGKNIISSLERNWSQAFTSGPRGLREHLHILGIVIDQQPKAIISKNSAIFERIFRNALDLPRQATAIDDDSYAGDEISEIESVIYKVALKMIYKLNDATFRPIFENLVEWAANGLPQSDKSGRILRLQSFYGLLAYFFENLKSIVTSYASYFIDNAVKVLSSINFRDDFSKELWSRVIQTLTMCFKHDQDDFWQTPSHFDAVAPLLCAQFENVSSLPIIGELVSSIVQLASAADSTDHHKQLNIGILKHTRSQAANVRLAAVRCEQELTDKLGEEWLSMLPEMLPFISELQEDDDEVVEKETHRWIVKIEGVLGESLDSMLQ